MRPYWIIYLLIFISAVQLSAQKLFPVTKGQYYGFIDSAGNAVIKPRFISVGKFSSGLAPARINGYYGYINTKGEWVIQPQYEYAESFFNGRAVVYVKGRPLFIDSSNQQYCTKGFSEIEPFENNLTIALTNGGKEGLLNRDGVLQIDTVYDYIQRIKPGYFVASTKHEDSLSTDRSQRMRSAFLDSTGAEFLRLNEQEKFYNANNDYLLVNRKIHEEGQVRENTLLIYRYNGELVLEKKMGPADNVEGISNGVIKINRNPLNEEGDPNWNLSYQDLMNVEGKMFFDNKDYHWISDFKSNRILLKKGKGYNENVYMLNTKGEILNTTPFDRYELFNNGYAFISHNRCEGIIDTNGNYVFNPEFHQLLKIDNDYFEYKDWWTDWCSGIAKFSGEIITPTIFQRIYTGFENGLLLGLIDDKLSYVNTSGEIVWQQAESSTDSLLHFNIDYMNRGYFMAYSTKRKNEPGGHASSGNYPREVSSDMNLTKDTLILKVFESTGAVYREKHKGVKVIVANTTTKNFDFEVQDSRLYMVMQAKTADGDWHDIEYLPNSFCGNSYHTLILQPSMYWEFTAPQYEGSITTKLRIKLSYNDPAQVNTNRWNRTMLTIYSNEFEGSINPGQFWRKPKYSPQNIMDPYFD